MKVHFRKSSHTPLVDLQSCCTSQ